MTEQKIKTKHPNLEKVSPSKLHELCIFGTIEKGKINHFTPPYAIRNNCQLGRWMVGEDRILGESLDIAIIGMKHFYGNLGKTAETQWLQLWFIGAPGEDKIPSNTVCVTYLKSQSLSDLGQKAIEIMNETDPGTGIWTANFDKKNGNYGTYYTLKWEWRERTTDEMNQADLIAEFLLSNPIFLDSGLPNTMIPLESASDPIELVEAHKELKRLVDQQESKPTS